MSSGIPRFRPATIVTLLLVAMCSAFVWAQTPLPQPKFAVEFSGEKSGWPVYAIVPEATPTQYQSWSVRYGDSLERLAGVTASPDQPSALGFNFKVVEDAVEITATVYYGTFDEHKIPTSLEGLRKQAVATHSGKMNDAVDFPELANFGLKPLTLRILPPQTSDPYRPMARSEAPSIGIEYKPVDRVFGKVTLHNLSNKAVDAVRVGNDEGEGSSTEESKGGLKELIAPGASHEIMMGIPHSGKAVNGQMVENPQPNEVVLQAVLFADGSYEGEARFAAKMAAREFGAKVELERVREIAAPILTEADVDDEAKIGRIRLAVRQLDETADAETIARFHAQYPLIPGDELSRAESLLGRAMQAEKKSVDSLIESNEPGYLAHRGRITLDRWWTAIAEGK